VAVDANTGQPAWVESKRGCLWVGSRVSKKASRPLEDAGARVRGCGFDEVRLRESSGVVSEVGRSVSKRRQIGSGRDFGSEERTRLFTERGTILDATAVARRSFFPRSFVRQVFSENLTPIQTSAAHPSCMHVYASTSHAQHLACPKFMHHLPKHNCTCLYHL
jgi:hypothetical protein